MEMTRILVVDDEAMIRFAFQEFLKDEGCTPVLAGDAEEALALLESEQPDIVFLDYRLPGRDGLQVLPSMLHAENKPAVVFMTAFGAMDVAIRAMQLGAYDYLTKPLDLGKIRILIRRILEGRRSLAQLERQDQGIVPDGALDRMVGTGPAMQEVFKMIGLLTTQDVTVLITGESGVGKELVARAIHENSPRGRNPFVAVNCGAMPENLLEAEMFGYEKGAFTGADQRKPGRFEAASGGTIFLDEIGDLQPLLQVKLLRVLQEKSFERVGGNTPVRTDARVMAATNRDLFHEVSAGRFRRDLFYRLNLVHVHLPPLRERPEDIPALVDHFVRKTNGEMGRSVRAVTREAIRKLAAHTWPGNIRELENQIKQAIVVTREEVLPEYLFQLESGGLPHAETGSSGEALARLAVKVFQESLTAPGTAASIHEQVLHIVEKALMEEALRRTDGNQVHAAELLGMNRSTLRKKRKEYGL